MWLVLTPSQLSQNLWGCFQLENRWSEEDEKSSKGQRRKQLIEDAVQPKLIPHLILGDVRDGEDLILPGADLPTRCKSKGSRLLNPSLSQLWTVAAPGERRHGSNPGIS